MHDVYQSAIEHYKVVFWVVPQNYLFVTTSQHNGNFECDYLRRGTW